MKSPVLGFFVSSFFSSVDVVGADVVISSGSIESSIIDISLAFKNLRLKYYPSVVSEYSVESE